MGFSDVTALLNWMSQSCGVVAFHGPMVAVEFAGELGGGVSSGFWDALTGKRRLWQIKGTGVLRNGDAPARGPLAGGCLSVLVTTLGTPYEIDTAGKIVFLEDVAELPLPARTDADPPEHGRQAGRRRRRGDGSLQRVRNGGGEGTSRMSWRTYSATSRTPWSRACPAATPPPTPCSPSASRPSWTAVAAC